MATEITSSANPDKMLAMDEVESIHRVLSHDISSIVFIETKDDIHYFEVTWIDVIVPSNQN